MQPIRIIVGDQRPVEAVLNDTNCAQALVEALPIQGEASLWGGEIYFTTELDVDLNETASDTVEIGQIGYWPPLSAVCLFCGQTPVSTPGTIRPASAVNIIGHITSEIGALKTVQEGDTIRLEAS